MRNNTNHPANNGQVSLMAYVSPECRQKIRDTAKNLEISFSTAVEQALWNWLDKIIQNTKP